MTSQLEDMGVKVMITVWPTVSTQSENFPIMSDQGLLVRSDRGIAFRADDGTYLYDPFNPEAREFLWSKVYKNYYQNGIEVFWLDASEPETLNEMRLNPDLRYFLGRDVEIGSMWPMIHQRTFYEGMKSVNSSAQVFTLCRSAWAGSQRWGAAVWSGDIESSFDSLSRQVRAGLNIMMSGIPWWTTDIGGFFNGNVTDPIFQELIVRWFQFGAFCPLTRLHGCRVPNDPTNPQCGFSCGPNEIWEFGDTAFEIISDVLTIRQKFRPYIMRQMEAASDFGTPPMRPLWFDFWTDPMTAEVDDQFMFGPDYMVAPILQYQVWNRTVYFPEGATWIDYFTQETYEGGQTVQVYAPLNRFPLYQRQ
eukprot:TRINITY_DN15600_c0_g1_i1.p1 TRINITY_DN15600_c0_g1~~TRINITY_DN15600_c0_g1_i1.p1  ORF type:complete len:395 (+),score=84.46 TRINITY_DN15600_c0_g1_i1:102-1187(+)